jgi:hypothetical protein
MTSFKRQALLIGLISNMLPILLELTIGAKVVKYYKLSRQGFHKFCLLKPDNKILKKFHKQIQALLWKFHRLNSTRASKKVTKLKT